MSRSGRRPPWRIRLRASCMENRFSPVASGGAYWVGERRMRQIVERIERLLVPAQAVGLRSPCRRRARSCRSNLPLTSTASRSPRADDLQHRLDALEVLGERHAADLHLHAGIAEVEIVLHLVLQPVEILAGIVVAAGGIDPRLVVVFPAVVAVGQQLPQRHAAWPWPRHPTAPCRARRPPPSARRGRPASRWPSSRPSTWPDRAGPRHRAASSGLACLRRGMKRSLRSPCWA